MKLREHIAFVYFDVWKFYVRVVLTNDLALSIRKLDPEAAKDPGPMTMHSITRPNRCCIVLPVDTSDGTLAHEAWHAVRRMFRYAGAELENETVAYHLGHLVEKIHKMLRNARWRDAKRTKKAKRWPKPTRR
jgi:hypothetical protein